MNGVFGEPEGPVRPRGNVVGVGIGGNANAKLCHHTQRCDAADAIACEFGEPHVAIWPSGYASRPGARCNSNAEYGYYAVGCNTAYSVRCVFREP